MDEKLFVCDTEYVDIVDNIYRGIADIFEDAIINPLTIDLTISGKKFNCAYINIDSKNTIIYTNGKVAYFATCDKPYHLYMGVTKENNRNLDAKTIIDMMSDEYGVNEGYMSEAYNPTPNLNKTGFYSMRNTKPAYELGANALDDFFAIKDNEDLFAEVLKKSETYNGKQFMPDLTRDNMLRDQSLVDALRVLTNGSGVKDLLKKMICAYRGVQDMVNNGTNVFTMNVEATPSSADEVVAPVSRKNDAWRKMVEEDRIKFENALDRVELAVRNMCVLVKEGRWTQGMNRCLIISGSPGIGKTLTLEKVLDEFNMVRNQDYVSVKGKTDATAVYNAVYKYNGKIIIFDDSSNMFNSNPRINFWKSLVDDKNNRKDPMKGNTVQAYRDNENDNTDSLYYDPNGKNSRMRFYAEIGYKLTKVDADKKKGADDGVTGGLEKATYTFSVNDKQKRKPKEFNFTGCCVVITNESVEQLEKQTSQRDFGALRSRVVMVNIDPYFYNIWEMCKKIMEKQDADHVPSHLKMFPDDIRDEMIKCFDELVDDAVENPNVVRLKNFNIRSISSFGYRYTNEEYKNKYKGTLRNDIRTEFTAHYTREI